MIEDASFFERLVQKGSDAIVSIDEESTVVFANESVERVFGYEPEELLGESLLTVMPDRFEEIHGAAVAEYLQSGERSIDWNDIQLPGKHRDGHEVPLSITFEEHTHEGETVFSGIIRDVSEQRTYERALETLQETAVELLAARDRDEVADIVVGAATGVLDFTHAIFYVHDRGEDRFHPLAWEGTFPEGEPPAADGDDSLTRQAFESGETVGVADVGEASPALGDASTLEAAMFLPIEDHGVLAVGSTRRETFDDRASTIAHVLATNAGAAMTRADREATLERRNDQLERFAGIVSHDLRDPLNTANAKVELARAELGESDYLAGLRTVHGRMAEIIEDVLTLTRQGRVVGDPTRVELGAVIGEAWETAVGNADVCLEVGEDLGRVGADRERLRTLFENLFGNAVHHAGGESTVRVGSLTGENGDGFYVEDDGSGIPPDERDEVFEYGYTTAENGTGIGLYTVRESAGAHGWSVRVTGGGDGGARFEVDVGSTTARVRGRQT
jgi:PAS domain S-box-containing protein